MTLSDYTEQKIKEFDLVFGKSPDDITPPFAESFSRHTVKSFLTTAIEDTAKMERLEAHDAAKRLKEDIIAACGKDGRAPEVGALVYLIDQIFFPLQDEPKRKE